MVYWAGGLTGPSPTGVDLTSKAERNTISAALTMSGGTCLAGLVTRRPDALSYRNTP